MKKETRGFEEYAENDSERETNDRRRRKGKKEEEKKKRKSEGS